MTENLFDLDRKDRTGDRFRPWTSAWVIARGLAGHGATVVLNDLDESKLEKSDRNHQAGRR